VLGLPRDLAAMGGALDAPIERYLTDSRRLALEHGTPFLDFVPELDLEDSDFYDLVHLVESGRPKYQARLAEETVDLLATDWIARTTAEQDAETKEATAPATRGAVPWVAGGAALAVVLGVGLAATRRAATLRRRPSGRRTDGPRRRRAPRRHA
jgi:hypothetical protein